MADIPTVTPERRALLQALAEQAAAWWRKRLEDPGYLDKFDNGDRSRTGDTTRLLASLAALHAPRKAASHFERFEQLLTEAVFNWLQQEPLPVFAISDTTRVISTAEQLAACQAQPARDLVLGVDYGPEGLLGDVAHEARVSGFPWKTTMWVNWDARPDYCYVEVRAGYGRPIERLPAVVTGAGA